MKAILHHAIVEQIIERNQTHALVMGHVRAHQRATLAFLDALRRVIQSFVKSVTGESTFALEDAQIFHRLSWRYVRCDNGRVRRNYEIFN